MQVTWSNIESCQSSEKESNGSEEYTNFIAFAASVNEEPLLKEASSESSDSNDNDMSFDTIYETLYKECLNLKQKQVKWKASKKIKTNEIDILKREKKVLLDKTAFLENEHLEVKKKYYVLKSESNVQGWVKS